MDTLVLVCKGSISLHNVYDDCRSYFFCTDSTAHFGAHFGQNNDIIIALDDVACTVYEPRLIDCPYDSNTADCTHSHDAGVQCVARELHGYINIQTVSALYHNSLISPTQSALMATSDYKMVLLI